MKPVYYYIAYYVMITIQGMANDQYKERANGGMNLMAWSCLSHAFL